ncbi:MAG: LytTR family DNA-binding domain-containing protein [Rhodothermales bacterium]
MLRVMIIDDEAPARTRLRRLLKDLEEAGRVAVAAEAESGVEGLEILQEESIDLLFLDIHMPGMDGFGVLERIDPTDRPVVIFTTAFDEYAVKAFEENAVDYLLKPVSQQRLEQAVERAERLASAPKAMKVREEQIGQLLDWLDARASVDEKDSDKKASSEYLKQISIPFRDRILIVPVERLVSAEISEGITRLNILEPDEGKGRPTVRQHIVSHTLDTLDSNLDPDQFMRVHRAAIVQINLINEMIPWFSGRYKLIMAGGHEVIASRERSKALKERLMM